MAGTALPAEWGQTMIGDLFDSPWKIAIVAVVLIVLFGSKKLPDAARSLGRSMRILKAEVTSMHGDEEQPEGAQQAPALPAPAHQQQIDALQQQIRDLQQQAAQTASVNGAPAGQSSQPQQPGVPGTSG
jgi:sec-independent protein translocase protein TatA